MKHPISLILALSALMLSLMPSAALRAEDTPVTTLSESVAATSTDTASATSTGTDVETTDKKSKKEKPKKEKKIKEKKVKEKKTKAPKTDSSASSGTSSGAKVPFDSSQTFTKGRFNLGVAGTAFFEFSDFDSLFMQNVNISDYRNAGFGGQIFGSYHFNSRWAITLDAFYDRLTYANKFRTAIIENYFGGDLLLQYHFPVKSRFAPFLAAGAGVIASSGGVLPLFDVGVGTHFFLSNNISLKAQVLYKTAIVENRIEPSIGIAFHFPAVKPAPVPVYVPPPVKVITLTGINFDTAQWTIRADSVPVLEANVTELTSSPKVTIKIIGHTDHRGSDSYNQGLSEKRAKAVMDWFVSHGVDATRISSEGRGESQPVAPNDTQDNMFTNRRIEIEITGGQ